jgi:hypothetical protein
MGNLDDFLNLILPDEHEGVTMAAGFFGLLADISGGVGLLQMVNVLQPADDQVVKALAMLQKTVEAGIADTNTRIAAEGMLAKIRDIDSGMYAANGVFGQLPTIIPQIASLSEGEILAYIETTFQATQFFTDYPDKWQAAWLDAPKYNDGWSGTVFPPQSQFVFNYTCVLPQFVRSIYIHLTVIAALQPSALTGSLNQIGKCVTQLQTVHDTIADVGLVDTKVPGQADVAKVDWASGLESWQSNWFDGKVVRGQNVVGGDPHLWPFGAVEMFSGTSIRDSYWPFLPFRMDPASSQPYPDTFFRLIKLRMANLRKALYKQVGLPEIRNVINQLIAISGQPIPTSNPYEQWSFREALTILGIQLNGSGAWTSLLAALKPVQPYSGGLLFPIEADLRYPPAALPMSFRGLFAPI